MTELIAFLVSVFSDLVGWLGSSYLVSGVSVLAFLLALTMIGIVINSFLLRGK